MRPETIDRALIIKNFFNYGPNIEITKNAQYIPLLKVVYKDDNINPFQISCLFCYMLYKEQEKLKNKYL